ncbi:subtilisin-like protease Pr1B [Podospora didyma]|uniref:Subtilisin-like protease Pr1B n=1 Tax=Podospora didyma TaxID=330526 RepID=A0AAE0K053_9PEZI|nr:subtilisin-like protease Pr1B [Podospora didyma]
MLFSAFALLGLLPATFAAPSTGPLDTRAPLIQARSPSKTLSGKYIVKLKDGSTDASLSKALGKLKAGHVYNAGGFKGFAATLDTTSLEAIRNLPEVEYVEEDAVLSVTPDQTFKVAPRATTTQANAPWNLARISSHANGAGFYRYDTSAGQGTCSYIIDTGIYLAHPQFGGNAVWGANFADTSNTDANGHGTAMAGVVGAIVLGVAKKTKLVAVKVFDASGSGTTSGVIAGMNFVVTDKATRGCPNGTTANLSIGGAYSVSVNNAATNLVNSGVHVGVAAGSSNTNLANTSPASAPLVCTAGASNSADQVASFSNYGPGLDIYAPGVNIQVLWLGTGTNTISGTSLSAAHITGLGAYLYPLTGPIGGAAMCNYIKSIATVGVLTGVPSGTNNLLAYNGIVP